MVRSERSSRFSTRSLIAVFSLLPYGRMVGFADSTTGDPIRTPLPRAPAGLVDAPGGSGRYHVSTEFISMRALMYKNERRLYATALDTMAQIEDEGREEANEDLQRSLICDEDASARPTCAPAKIETTRQLLILCERTRPDRPLSVCSARNARARAYPNCKAGSILPSVGASVYVRRSPGEKRRRPGHQGAVLRDLIR
jgi:hypothetical protein